MSIEPCELFKTLSDATRLQILLLLHQQGELCVCELSHAIDAPQPRISRHLAWLKERQLINDRRQGLWIFYQLNEPLPEWINELLTSTEQANPELLQQPRQRLNTMSQRPARDCCTTIQGQNDE